MSLMKSDLIPLIKYFSIEISYFIEFFYSEDSRSEIGF